MDAGGALRAQQDGPGVAGFQSTSTWQPGATIQDNHGLALPEDLPPGRYTLCAALYDWQTLERLPATGPDGQPLRDNLACFTTVMVAGQ